LSIEDLAASRGWSEEEARLRNAICEIGKLAYSKGFIVGADGNISARMSDGTVLITPAGAMKGFLSPEHVAHIDMQARVIDNGPKCSTEAGIHLVDEMPGRPLPEQEQLRVGQPQDLNSVLMMLVANESYFINGVVI